MQRNTQQMMNEYKTCLCGLLVLIIVTLIFSGCGNYVKPTATTATTPVSTSTTYYGYLRSGIISSMQASSQTIANPGSITVTISSTNQVTVSVTDWLTGSLAYATGTYVTDGSIIASAGSVFAISIQHRANGSLFGQYQNFNGNSGYWTAWPYYNVGTIVTPQPTKWGVGCIMDQTPLTACGIPLSPSAQVYYTTTIAPATLSTALAQACYSSALPSSLTGTVWFWSDLFTMTGASGYDRVLIVTAGPTDLQGNPTDRVNVFTLNAGQHIFFTSPTGVQTLPSYLTNTVNLFANNEMNTNVVRYGNFMPGDVISY